MNFRLIVLVVLLQWSTESVACTCHLYPSLCNYLETVNLQSQNNRDHFFILRGRIAERIEVGKGVLVEVIELLHGNEAIGDTIFIHNGSSASCEKGTGWLIPGKEYLMTPRRYPENYGWHYYLPACFNSYLNIENDSIVGPLIEGIDKVHFEDMKQLMNCGTWETYYAELPRIPFPEEDILENEIVIAPNPMSDQLYIKLRLTRPRTLMVRLYDRSGVMVLQHSFADVDRIERKRIDVHHLPSGLYILEIEGWDYPILEKMVKI